MIYYLTMVADEARLKLGRVYNIESSFLEFRGDLNTLRGEVYELWLEYCKLTQKKCEWHKLDVLSTRDLQDMDPGITVGEIVDERLKWKKANREYNAKVLARDYGFLAFARDTTWAHVKIDGEGRSKIRWLPDPIDMAAPFDSGTKKQVAFLTMEVEA